MLQLGEGNSCLIHTHVWFIVQHDQVRAFVHISFIFHSQILFAAVVCVCVNQVYVMVQYDRFFFSKPIFSNTVLF